MLPLAPNGVSFLRTKCWNTSFNLQLWLQLQVSESTSSFVSSPAQLSPQMLCQEERVLAPASPGRVRTVFNQEKCGIIPKKRAHENELSLQMGLDKALLCKNIECVTKHLWLPTFSLLWWLPGGSPQFCTPSRLHHAGQVTFQNQG